MLQTEFIRSMQCNYERILLEEPPEEKRYQYCILSRGGMKGLLPCSLRYLNGTAYLYYDISSRQSVAQLYAKRSISRQWVRDFIWSLGRLRMELGRFLLDDENVLWYPEQIFQDLESNVFSYIYIPYYKGENSFSKLLEYLVERIDYDDEMLVECVYKMYEQYERSGEVYLQAQIFEDVKVLEEIAESSEPVVAETEEESPITCEKESVEVPIGKKGIRYLFDGRKKKDKNARIDYHKNLKLVMEGYSVAEESGYEASEDTDEDYGRTVYIEDSNSLQERIHRLYTTDGRIVMQLVKENYTIGKRKEESDLVLEDFSVSRMHARISKEAEGMFLEDLNSTNGTFKNGVRLEPYEKKRLEEGDEIKIGKIVLLYR